jgi:hypothetical protein
LRKIIILFLFILVGCGSIQSNIIHKEHQAFNFTGKPIEIREIKDLISIKDDLNLLPDVDVDFRFYKGVNINDFCNALSHGIPEFGFIVDFFSPEEKYIIPRFKGKLKDLFSLLQNAYGFTFQFNGKTVIIKDNCQVVLKIPSVFADHEKEIKDLMSIFEVQPDDIHIDFFRGVVVSIMNNQQYTRLKKYLSDYGIFQFQIDIAVIEETATKGNTVGIDLSRLGAAISNSLPVGSINAIGSTLAIISGGNNFAFSLGLNNFLTIDSVIAAYSSLSSIKLDQRVRMGVLSGSAAKMDLSRKVPYVSQITAVTGNVGSATSGYTFDTAQDGLIIEIKPTGDDDLINVSTSINYQQITDYVSIGVGKDTISRPVVQSRSYKAEYSIRPGEVALIGSLRVLDDSHMKKGIFSKITYSDQNTVMRDLSIFMGVSIVKYKMI